MKSGVLWYVFLYLLHVRSESLGFRSKTKSYAQDSLAALKLPFVSLKISLFRSNFLFLNLGPGNHLTLIPLSLRKKP
jgi:hypothetical protein